jgi:hypothetical protein
VTSVYARLEARDTTSSIKRDNYAVSGARIGDLASQGATVTQGTDLVTILTDPVFQSAAGQERQDT